MERLGCRLFFFGIGLLVFVVPLVRRQLTWQLGSFFATVVVPFGGEGFCYLLSCCDYVYMLLLSKISMQSSFNTRLSAPPTVVAFLAAQHDVLLKVEQTPNDPQKSH